MFESAAAAAAVNNLTLAQGDLMLSIKFRLKDFESELSSCHFFQKDRSGSGSETGGQFLGPLNFDNVEPVVPNQSFGSHCR